MIFDFKYNKSSAVAGDATSTTISFSPDTLRAPVFFEGTLNKKLPFREAISALHDVVISDQRFKPRDTTAYKEWMTSQEKLWLADYMEAERIGAVKERIAIIKEELTQVQGEKNRLLKPYYTAQRRYFDYLYAKDKDAWIVLDPVITVHPDELFFECFSQDESSYGKLSCSHNVFNAQGAFQCGTTNIDYSEGLYAEFQKIRSYKNTGLVIDPSGFAVATGEGTSFKEVKIDLPDSWIRGFLQVSTAMTLPATSFDLHPMDIYTLCQYLRRHKEKEGPRALRFVLEPDRPVSVIVEPWYETLVFNRSVYKGAKSNTIRIWGRRRLLILERLIPVTQKFTVHLMGSGLPSFFIAHMGDLSFTLGLSGWTNNDWSTAGSFDLMAPRNYVEVPVKEAVFNELRKKWFIGAEELAAHLCIETSTVHAALTAYTQAGMVIYDLVNACYRIRELSATPIDMQLLRYTSDRERAAAKLIEEERIRMAVTIEEEQLYLRGHIGGEVNMNVLAVINKDQQLVDGDCNCVFFKSNQLKKGPCEHILAVRMQFAEDNFTQQKN